MLSSFNEWYSLITLRLELARLLLGILMGDVIHSIQFLPQIWSNWRIDMAIYSGNGQRKCHFDYWKRGGFYLWASGLSNADYQGWREFMQRHCVHQACIKMRESLCVNVWQGGTEGDTCFMPLAGSSITKRRGLNPACSVYSTQFNNQICSVCYCNGGYILLYLGQNL